MALYRCGGGNASTLIAKSITQNGIYNASADNADGYSSVNVNVSGGGGGNCTINTKAQWDALTFAQKKAQGLTVVRNSSLDAIGNWFDLTNANSEYLPFSSNIVCDASIDNFDATSHSWGGFTLSNILTANADGIGVDVNGRNASPDCVYYDLGDKDTDFTAYIVFRYSTSYGACAVLGASYQESNGNCAYIIEDSMTNIAGVCNGRENIGNPHIANTYIVSAIRNNSKTISFFKNATKGTDRTAFNVGQNVTIATQYPNLGGYGTNITVAYAGVINEAEIDFVVINNMRDLMTRFEIV